MSEFFEVVTRTGVLRLRRALLEQLAESAAAGYRLMPWGGIELGGLLLGRRAGSVVEVVDTRPIDCEHDYGPSFELSPRDIERLEAQRNQPLPDGLVCAGWYHTTSRELFLIRENVAIAQRFFGEPWQVSLVIQRGREIQPRFGAFLRGLDGDFNVLSPDHAFTAADWAAASPKPDPPMAPLLALPEFPPLVAARVAPVALAGPEAIRPPVVLPQPAWTPDFEPPSPAPVVPIPVDESPAEPEFAPAPGADIEPDRWPEAPAAPAESLGLAEDPFAPEHDPRFFYPSAQHREALATLEYAVSGRKGIALMTGERGSGKTFLLECLIAGLRESGTDFALIADSRLSVSTLFQSIAIALQLPVQDSGKPSVLFALQRFAAERAAAGHTLVLLFDEVQNMTPEILAEIELLDDIQSRRSKLLQIVLSGRPAVVRRLAHPSLIGLRQRITLQASLKPMSAEDSLAFLETRIGAAGGELPEVFARDTALEVCRRSAGVPGQLMLLARTVMELAAQQALRPAPVRLVEEAAQQGGPVSQPVP